ncbi:iron-sulfur cluster assembly protein (plasmid) [Salipiger sp. H15]|uniref:Iron-sulfur cluster assembly protein n=1 Tax=Alloyangia sp. H15 TaxID=3029062 RepID=A0AAU8ASN9_9RHOB
MMTDIIRADLETDVWERLERVTDPELDEPVTEMGFVERVEVIDARRVEVDFRLPTYWCSPNFAFLMAFGIRREIDAMPWVREARVTLRDHCFGDEVNAGVNSGRPFSEVFSEYCNGADLAEVTATFLAKAYDRRQESVLLALRRRGLAAGDLVGMSLRAFDRVTFDTAEEARQAARYRDLLVSRGLVRGPEDPAFPTWDGRPIAEDAFPAHLDRLRGTRINMEFNGALCRGLASVRYKEVRVAEDGPTLVDFLLDRVPPRHEAAARK